jgi:hypothetical protein
MDVYSMFVLSCVGRGLAMSWSLVQGVLPTVLDKETEMKQKVSRMRHAPVWAKKGINNNKKIAMVQNWCVLPQNVMCATNSYKKLYIPTLQLEKGKILNLIFKFWTFIISYTLCLLHFCSNMIPPLLLLLMHVWLLI